MNHSRIIWVDTGLPSGPIPYYAGGTLKQQKVLIGQHGSEVFVPSIDVTKLPTELLYEGNANMQRINVRDQWNPAKVHGTLPWDGMQTERRFSWVKPVNGHATQQIISLQVHRLRLGDTDEMAYMSGGHAIEVLRKLPEFAEKTDER